MISSGACTSCTEETRGSASVLLSLIRYFVRICSISCSDVSKVENMKRMFNGARVFNHCLAVEDVSKVEDMGHMFRDAAEKSCLAR